MIIVGLVLVYAAVAVVAWWPTSQVLLRKLQYGSQPAGDDRFVAAATALVAVAIWPAILLLYGLFHLSRRIWDGDKPKVAR